MNRTTLGILALAFSFFCMAVLGFASNNSSSIADPPPTPVPRRTNPSDPTPKRSPYKNPSDPTPKRSPSENPSDPTPSPQRNPSDPKSSSPTVAALLK
jgi:hypothetical protein